MTKVVVVTVAVPDRPVLLADTSAALARQTVSCEQYTVLIGHGQNAPALAADPVMVRLPIGARNSIFARGIGMQLAFNNKADVVTSIVAGTLLDARCVETVAAAIVKSQADILELRHPAGDPSELGTLFFTKRAAFVPGLWAQVPPALEARFRQTLQHLVMRLRLRVVALELPLVTFPAGAGQSAESHAATKPIGEEAARLLYHRTGVLLRPVGHAAARKVDTVAVITPYYKESSAMLRRCHDSVMSQGENVKHFMVADGFPNPDVDRWDATHIALPMAHGDNGNTPRGLGGMIAFAKGFDAVTYLDADNWYAEGHIKSMLKAQRRSGARVVCAWRIIVLPDGTQLEQIDPEDRQHAHVDTSCFLITKEVAFLAKFWAQMPQKFGPVCDRAFLGITLETAQLICWTERQTVYFESNYGLHYRMANKAPGKPLHDIPGELWRQIDPVEFRHRTGWSLSLEKKWWKMA